MKFPSLIAYSLLSVSFLSLIACTPAVDTVGADYLARLSSVLESEFTAENIGDLDYPTPRDLVITGGKATISIREFLSIRQCKLHTALAEKNSLIGKFAEPSQALFMDLEVLHTAPECVTQLQKDQQLQLAEKLSTGIEEKKQGLATKLWLAILGADEHRKFWQSASTRSNYPGEVNSQVVPALQVLLRFVEQVQDGNYQVSLQQQSDVERSLNVLRSGDGGALFKRLIELDADLNLANQLLKQRIEQPLCLNGSPTQSARYLQNVVNKFFIDVIQRQAVALKQRYQQLMPVYQKLETKLLSGAPPAYLAWRKDREAMFNAGLAAPKKHVSYLQTIYSQCGLQAG